MTVAKDGKSEAGAMKGVNGGTGGTHWSRRDSACPLCASNRHYVLGRRGGTAHHARLGVETSIVRCGRCHGVYQRPVLRPSSNPYEATSGEEYFQKHDYAAKVEAGNQLAARAEAFLRRAGRLLELGCGHGGLLVGAQQRGWSVRGVDMTPGFAEASPGVEIEISPVETAASLRETYDFIVLAAILEHVYDPLSCLKAVHQALNPGGVVFIDVPNECGLITRFGNLYMRLRGRDWAVNLSPTFPPYHVVGFCPRSLKWILRQCGFEIVEMSTQRWRNDLPARPGLWPFVERLGLSATLAIGASLNMGAGISCWARKETRPEVVAHT